MSILIFGNGPMLNEPNYAVMAPGSRTWQIVRTVAQGLIEAGSVSKNIIVLGLDETPRKNAKSAGFHCEIQAKGQPVTVEYSPLPYELFKAVGMESSSFAPPNVQAIVATGSVQAYSTAAGFSKHRNLPLWIDIFGDPICETQSQLELLADQDQAAADNKLVHVWKLLLDGLLQGDRFYGLSQRQRHAIQGQLGCTGRLNQYTSAESISHYLPYCVFEEDLKNSDLSPRSNPNRFTIMWSGSFNTWMDVPTLTLGITDALKADPTLHLLVVGGKINGYNEVSYSQFLEGIRKADVQGSVTLMDWQPLSEMQKLYAQCNIGISIDRYTYEAELGSRTRLINFLAAGLPVASTTVTELSCQLAEDKVLAPFELGSAESLTKLLLAAAQGELFEHKEGNYYRDYILQKFNGGNFGSELRDWIAKPTFAKDKNIPVDIESTNELLKHWKTVREPLGY